MPLLNYTTQVSVEKTVSDIQRELVKAGARSVSIDYGADQKPISIFFVIPTKFGDREFRMPVNEDGVFKALKDEWNKGKIRRGYVDREHAARVAWRITLDWLRFQLAVIETQMVSLDEIFLPYMLNGEGSTLYQIMLAKRLSLPAPAPQEAT